MGNPVYQEQRIELAGFAVIEAKTHIHRVPAPATNAAGGQNGSTS
jgi:hypothetical protein